MPALICTFPCQLRTRTPACVAGTRLVGCRLCRCDVSDCCDTNTRAGGYGQAKIDKQLTNLGVTNVVIPRKGKPSQARRKPTNTKSVPPNHQMANRMRRPDRHPQTRIRLGPHPLDSLQGAKTWTGQGIFTHNLIKIAALTA